MPKSTLILPDIQNAQLGISLPLAYGYIRARGNEIINHQLGNKSRIIFRILGEGEWDGIERLWINSKLSNFSTANVVSNGDGETGTVGSQAPSWTLEANSGLLIANDFVHSGSGSLKITNAAASNSYSYQQFNMSDGDVWRLQGWIKTTALTASGGGGVLNLGRISGVSGFRILVRNGTVPSNFNAASPAVGIPADGAAHDWTFVSCDFGVAGTGVIKLWCQLDSASSGSAWFDEVQLIKLGTALVHFHPGTDGTLADGLTPVSNGGDQRVDILFSQLPAAFQPVTFSRKAYLAGLFPPDPAAPGPTVDILGDYRCLKVRQFDSSGAQTAYAFSTNGAWQIADLLLRSYLRPEWLTSGAAAAGGDLATNEKARIDFASLADAAAKCDALLSDGNKRFESNVAFTATTSLADALAKLQNISQIFVHEAGGKIYIRADQLRSSSFILTSDHVLPGTFTPDKTDLHGAKNRLIATFRDVNPANTADIDTPANTGLSRSANVVTVKTKTAHPYLVGDSVVILPPLDGSTHDTSFDGTFPVASVPTSTTFTYAQSGTNATSGNGYTGTPESRFAQRADKIDHEQHQQTIGQRGLGLTPAFRVVPAEIDLGNNIFSRVRRIIRFIQRRYLGMDQAPYNSPFACKVIAFMDAVDLGLNIIPDSDGVLGAWTLDALIPFVAGIGAVRGGGWRYTGTGAASGFHFNTSKIIQVQPGQTYTLSGYINATNVTAGNPSWFVYDPTITTQYALVAQTAGVNGRISVSFTVPAGVTQVVVLPDTSNCTVAASQFLSFSNPQLEIGAAASSYVVSLALCQALIEQLCGDILTIDATVSEEFQGDYEIQKMIYNIPAPGSGSSAGASDSQSGDAPTIELTLLQYVTGAYSDAVITAQAVRASQPRDGLTPATVVDAGGTPRLRGSFRNNPLNVQGAYTGANPVTQSGVTKTINIASNTQQFGDGSLSYNSGSVTPATYGTFFIYGIDLNFQGGLIAYLATATNSSLYADNGSVYFGQITTSAGGGGSGSGGGGGGCFSGNTRIRVANMRGGFSLLSFDELTGDLIRIETEFGPRSARKHSRYYKGWMREMGGGELVTPEHLIKVTDGFFAPASTIWPDQIWYEGMVHTLETVTENDAERHFILGNGRIAHNLSP